MKKYPLLFWMTLGAVSLSTFLAHFLIHFLEFSANNLDSIFHPVLFWIMTVPTVIAIIWLAKELYFIIRKIHQILHGHALEDKHE